MNREDLESLELEKTTIDSVMKLYGKSVNEIKDKGEKVDALETQVADYKEQITERDNQLEELNKVDPEAMKEEITRLKKANEDVSTEYQQKLDKQSFDFSLEKALSGAKARNTKAVKANLDMDLIKLDGGELKGLTEQLETLKESDSYLFEQEEPPEKEPKPKFTKGTHSKGSQFTGQDIKELNYKDRMKFKKDNPTKYDELVGK